MYVTCTFVIYIQYTLILYDLQHISFKSDCAMSTTQVSVTGIKHPHRLAHQRGRRIERRCWNIAQRTGKHSPRKETEIRGI